MSRNFRWRGGLCAMFLTVISCHCDTGPRLEVLNVSQDRIVELRVAGLTGLEAALETSTDLSAWRTLSGLTLTNGEALYRHQASSEPQALFYRAVIQTGSPRLDV